MPRFRDQAEQAAVNNLTEFLDSGIQQADNLKDAFRALALSIVEDLKRIAAQALATSIVRGVGSLIPGGGTPAAATGGLLVGPGTGTSDSMLARVSNGEFVVRAAVVSQPGVLSHLSALNSGNVPKFNAGGLVGDLRRFAEGGLAETSGGESQFRGRLEIGLADGLEVKQPPVSDRFIIDVVRRNSRQIQEAIGR